MGGREHRTPINALRGFAAIWVVVYHFRYFSPYPWHSLPIIPKGYMGVDFFFVLSGLIISHVYLDRMVKANGWAEHARFLALRIARIWPLHAFIMLAMLVAALWHGTALTGRDWSDWLSLTLLVRQWLMPPNYVWNSPAWSVSAELFAYAFVFPLVIYFARQNARPQAAWRMMLVGLALLCALLVAGETLNATKGMGPLVRVTGGFFLGAGLYCWLYGKQMSNRWDIALVLGTAGFPVALWVDSDLAVLTALMALTVGAYMSTGPIARLLSARPLFLLGEWSFGLYLLHIPMFEAARFFSRQMGIERGITFCVAVLVLSVACAAMLHSLIETPARKAARVRIEEWYGRAMARFAPGTLVG